MVSMRDRLRLLAFTLRNAVSRPITVDISRSVEREVLRGYPKVNPEKCIGCSLCARSCPSDAITMKVVGKQVLGGKQVDKKIPFFNYYKCIYCSLCSNVCPVKAIDMIKGTPLDALEQAPSLLYASLVFGHELKVLAAYVSILVALAALYLLSRAVSARGRHQPVAYEPFAGGGTYNRRWEKYYVPSLLRFVMVFLLIEIVVFATLIYETPVVLFLSLVLFVVALAMGLKGGFT
ncbi:4Fe-4S binding protein [Thermogladius sp. KZ2Tp1]|uniref:NADH-quinone oxidoreductase subunit I n=1 Tax=Thermogladius sp. KZ2Tp1 TaxID=3136289 RepID=UPI003DA897BD